MRVQLLGLCRFSYLGGRGFQVEHETIEQRRAFLYDPARLARRWFWFQRVTLPAWRAQTDPDFKLIIMTGPDLPEPYMSQLRQLAQDVPQVRLSLVPPRSHHLPACWEAVAPHIDPSADVVGHFRQDDDDAVAIDYVVRARRDFRRIRPIWRADRRAALDYMSGLVVTAGADGVSVEPRMIYNAVAALTIFLAPDDPRTACHFPHWRLAHHMPVVAFGDRIMYCRLLNGDNDSGAVGVGYDFDAPPGPPAGILKRRFAIDLPSLDAAARTFAQPAAPRSRKGRA